MTAIDVRQTKLKAISQLRYLLIGACLLSGWLAGNSLDKYLIRVPAWRRFDLTQWAEFTRHEYLNYGFYVYVSEALGCFVLLLIALIIALKLNFRFIKWHLLFAFISAMAFTIMTFYIAPLLFKLRSVGNDPVIIKNIFDEVNYWGIYRGIFHVTCFILCLFAVGRSFVLRYVNNS